MVGETISHYRILEKLGEGGMGVVYKAEDTTLKRIVALKFLSPWGVEDEEEKTRFMHEAQAAAALDDANVCAVHEIDESGGKLFIVMAYVEGQSLKERLRSGPLKIEEALDIAIQIAQGLQAAHEKGIVHRDIKPANILLNQKGQVRITDFGLAKLQDRTQLTKTGTTMGTVAYMSPEQARGAKVDHRTDIWALGVVLYEMITGQLPFKGDYEQAVLYSIVYEEPEPVTRIRPELPPALDEILKRALAKDPQQRYQTTEEFLKQLQILKNALVLPQRAHAASVLGPSSLSTKLVWAIVPLVLLTMAAIFFLRSPDSPPVLPPRHTQVTFLGDANLPALSPDGKFIAFTRGIGGSEEAKRVYVQEIGIGRELQVFEVEGGIREIAWSPDGSALLVAVSDDGIYLVPRLGGTARRYPLRGSEVTWAPDGMRFAIRPEPLAMSIIDRATGASEDVSLDSTLFASRGGPVFSTSMDWSPSSDWIVLGHLEKDGATLWTVNARSRKMNRIVKDSTAIYSPQWSPDGDAVYYVRYRSGRPPELWKVSVNPRSGKAEGKPRFLLGGIRMGRISMARERKLLLYVRSTFQSNLWSVKHSGLKDAQATPQQLTYGTVTDYEPAISPDGKQVAFVREAGAESHIYVVPIEGGEPQRLTFLNAFNTSPAWSPDGTRLAFIIELNGSHQLGMVNADGSNEHALPESQPTLHFLSWAPAKRIVYLGKGGNRLHFLDPVTGEETRFPKEKPWPRPIVFGFFLSPDGRRVAFVSSNPKGKFTLYVASLETDEWKAVLENPGPVIGWTADGTGLYMLQFSEKNDAKNPPGILLISADSGKRVSQMTLPFNAKEVSRCVRSPDGKTVVCIVQKRQADLWLLENFDPEN